MTDPDLIQLLARAADALEREAIWLVDVDTDDLGRSKPSIPVRDKDYYDAVTEQAQAIRDLIAMVQARSRAA
jgi:hypothetical protein